MTDYRVALEIYNGPLDLLLYLIKREEIDIHDIPIARVTSQYIEYVQLLETLDPEAVSEFLVLAATLTEIKSRMLLPRPPAEVDDEEFVDPRAELVRQLLQYKAFKDAAQSLEDAADVQSKRHPRTPADMPADESEVELEDLEIWDLFDAFNNLLSQIGKGPAVHRVDVDDTPISLHAEDIVDSLQRSGGTQHFAEVFAHRRLGEMIGLFLAMLELIRQRRIRASQDESFGPILIHLLSAEPIDAAAAEEAMAPPEPNDADVAATNFEIEDREEQAAEESSKDESTVLAEEIEPVEGHGSVVEASATTGNVVAPTVADESNSLQQVPNPDSDLEQQEASIPAVEEENEDEPR